MFFNKYWDPGITKYIMNIHEKKFVNGIVYLLGFPIISFITQGSIYQSYESVIQRGKGLSFNIYKLR